MILDARPLVEAKIKEIRKITDLLVVKPKLAIIRVGNDPASVKYVNNKVKLCDRAGLDSEIVHMEEDSTVQEVRSAIRSLNSDKSISGVLLQLPLPEHLKAYEDELTQLIKPEKDADGFAIENLGKLMIGQSGARACTPSGIMSLLEYYNIDVEGKDVLIINRSNIVGKPLALMMLEKNATVTVAHSRTANLKDKCKRADIVVTAIGRPNSFYADDFKKDAVIVDVSINFDANGKMCGDVCKADYDKIHAITPVPFGVGQTTVLSLIEQTVHMHLKSISRFNFGLSMN